LARTEPSVFAGLSRLTFTRLHTNMMKLIGFAGLVTAPGLNIGGSNPSYLVSGDYINVSARVSIDSRPGTTRMAQWEGAPLRSDLEAWRVKLGDRLLEAADAHDAMQSCGAFFAFGDYSWCKKAMPRESSPDFRHRYQNVHEFVVDEGVKVPPANPEDFAGLSFGIRTSDAWTELMSSMFLVRTELYDCYFGGKEGPMANDWHEGYSKDKPCTHRGCYTVEYKTHRVCNDDTTENTGRFTAANGRTYEPLHHALEGRGKLSTFIKMDVEGSEWATLDRLLGSEEDLAKIRTLDMEVHFNLDATPKGMLPITARGLARHVEIMERLARKFAVTGSSLESYSTKTLANYRAKRAQDPAFVDTGRPAQLYTKDGLGLDQYTISFVNRALL